MDIKEDVLTLRNFYTIIFIGIKYLEVILMKIHASIPYESPCILDRIVLEQETAILQTSVAEALNADGVDIVGQEVKDIDFSNETQFKHEWL